LLEPHGRTTSKAVIITNIKKGEKTEKMKKRKKCGKTAAKPAAKRRRIGGSLLGSFHNKNGR
jgi:hypothetical protein